jgi:hypothetical protein
MAAKKYLKNVYEAKEGPIKAPERAGKIVATLTIGSKQFPESPNWVYSGLIYAAGAGYGCGDTMEETLPDGNKRVWQTAPHTHKVSETFIFTGTDPQNPQYLGGEVELWLGEGEAAEKYVITKTTAIFIPANLVHSPVWVNRVDRPFIFTAVLNDPAGSEEAGSYKFPPGFPRHAAKS